MFSKWQGDLTSTKNPEIIDIQSDMNITAVFLEDYDNDGVSDEEENAGPNNGDGNDDGTADSLQSNVSCLMLGNVNDFVAIESPPGTSIQNCKAIMEPPNNNFPSEAEFPYGFFEFDVEGIGIGASIPLTFYFPSNFTFNTYYKYGPTPDNPFDHWYEFIFDGETGAEIDDSTITIYFVDGKRGDDDLTEDGNISDIGGPGITGDDDDDDDDDGGGCFISNMLE